jgi:hypothetical protein
MHKRKDEDKQNYNTTQYVLDTTIYKRKDEDKQKKTVCVVIYYIYIYSVTSVDTEMCCPKGKCGCQYFILLA